jgi:ribosome-associated translation inhibitor RaiA
MHHTDQRRQLRVEIVTQECELPRDELSRIQNPLDRVALAAGDLPSELDMRIVHHPRSQRFHVEAALSLPRRTIFTGDWDDYLDTALNRCLRKLIRQAEEYQQEPQRKEDETASHIERMNRNIMAPQDPSADALGAAASIGDFHAFRRLLSGHEEWLRLRIGRWLQRYPELEAELGRRLSIGDLLEEVFLNAFERYNQRSNDVPLHRWLDSLIDPSLHDFRHDPVEARQNISFARTLKDMTTMP